MTHRTTFALDEETASRLKRLSKKWNVSQAEVVRRAVSLAETGREKHEASPLEKLRALHSHGGGMVREEAEAYLAEVKKDRDEWRSL